MHAIGAGAECVAVTTGLQVLQRTRNQLGIGLRAGARFAAPLGCQGHGARVVAGGQGTLIVQRGGRGQGAVAEVEVAGGSVAGQFAKSLA